MKERFLKAKLDLLIKKRNAIPLYNLSGAAWKDQYSNSEIDRLKEKNEKNQKKKEKIEREIVSVISELSKYSNSIQDIITQYPELSFAAPELEETESKTK
jgi:hypothetical protein